MENENEVSLTFGNKTAVFRIATGAGASTKYVEVSAEGFNIANQFPDGSKYTSLDKIHVEVPEANKPSQYFVSILVPDGLKVGDLSFSDGTNVKLISDENLATPVAVNSIYTVTALNWEVIGALKGVFSVSADRKVHFSQGNLYYDGNKFGFEAEQYHFRTYQGKGKCDAKGYSKTSGTNNGHWGLFGWVGESSTAFTSSPQIYGVSTSTTTSDYGNVPGEALKADWGKAIGDDSTWRTLTKDEWCYLLAYDPEKDGFINNSPRYNLFKTGVKVCGVENCIVIAPDGWDISSKPLQKEYDATTWEQAKAAGLVCLPAAGGRDGSSLDDVGVCGYYWSSSARNESRAYFVQFASAAVHAYADGAFRRSGFSVRLVTDVKVDPVAAYTSAYLDTISSVPAWEFDLTTWDGDDSKCADIYVKAEMAGKVCGNYTIESSGAFAGEAFTSTFGGKPVASGTISITLLEPETNSTRAYYEIQIAGVTQDGNAFSCKYGSTITAYDAKGYSVSVIDDGYVPEPVCFEIPDVADISNAVYVQNQIGVTIRVTGSNNPAMTTASCETKTVTIDGRQYSFGRKLNTGGKFNLDSKEWRKISVYAPARGTMYVITDGELGFVEIGSEALTKGDGYVSFFADFENGRNEYTLTFASAIDIYGFVFVPGDAN